MLDTIRSSLQTVPPLQRLLFVVSMILLTSSIVHRMKNVVETNDDYIYRSKPIAMLSSAFSSAADGGLKSPYAPPKRLVVPQAPQRETSNSRPTTTTSTADRYSLTQGAGAHKGDEQRIDTDRTPHTKKKHIAIGFFGLVKSIDPEQLLSYEEAIFRPLREAGYTLHGFLHSFSMEEFRNPANRGEERARFNQSTSIEQLRSVLPELTEVWLDNPRDADAFFGPPTDYLANGEPWPFNPVQSIFYYLRQQYSLIRLTEMWTGSPILPRSEGGARGDDPPLLRALKQGTTLEGFAKEAETLLFAPPTAATGKQDGSADRAAWSPRALSYEAVLYLRPDVIFRSQVNVDGVAALAATQSELEEQRNGPDDVAARKRRKNSASTTRNPRRVAIPTFEHHGFNDRFAFGTPQGMRLYGLRGLALQSYVQHSMPHAETFVKDYLCHAHIEAHMSPIIFSRRRSGGIDQDGTVHDEASHLLYDRVPRWGEIQAVGYHVDRRGGISSTSNEVDSGGGDGLLLLEAGKEGKRPSWRRCALQSLWALVPLRRDAAFLQDRSDGETAPLLLSSSSLLKKQNFGPYQTPTAPPVRTDVLVFVLGLCTLLAAVGVRVRCEGRTSLRGGKLGGVGSGGSAMKDGGGGGSALLGSSKTSWSGGTPLFSTPKVDFHA